MRVPSNMAGMASNGPRKAERVAERAGVGVWGSESLEIEGSGLGGVVGMGCVPTENPWGDSITHKEISFEQWIQTETDLTYWEWSDRDERERERARKEHDRKSREYASWCWNATH